jgi:hypothetical protein
VRNSAVCFRNIRGHQREICLYVVGYRPVESSLPEDIMLVWERPWKSRAKPTEHDILTNLLTLLSLKYFELARSGLDYKYYSKGPALMAEKTTRAACIFSSDVRDSDRVAHVRSCRISHSA